MDTPPSTTVNTFNNILASIKEKVITYDTLKTQDLAVLEEIIGTFQKLYRILKDIVSKRQNNEPEADSLKNLFAPCLQNGITTDEHDEILRSLYTNLIEYPYAINRKTSVKLSPIK